MITDEQRNSLLQQYKDRGIIKKEIRSYEVSLWSLQDEFITVLKWSDAEQIGRIENPKMTLNIDGTQKLSFSIPMYYRQNGKLIENPNWYTVQTEKLLVGLRKLKVIFNKGEEYNAITEEERSAIRSSNVFEFVITNVTESHENDIPTCNIDAEGLAFQELGKIGYKISLSLDDFEEVYRQWYEYGYWLNSKNMLYSDFDKHIIVSQLPSDNIDENAIYLLAINTKYYDLYIYDNDVLSLKKVGSANRYQPIADVKYWCENDCGLELLPYNDSSISFRTWYYDIRMDWSAYDDGLHRLSGEVYEDPYITNWDENLKATGFSELEPKARIIEIENSNLYNITQTIAEQFGIYCRYEYKYNENYQIIGRVIVFYNNFMQEREAISFIYPYSASKTERVIESSDITTKLYVLSADNDSILDGQSTIMDVPANRSQEDYILNFDYLKEIDAITKEQYNAIEVYEKEMRQLNKELSELQRKQIMYENKKIDLEAKKTVYENSIKLAAEEIYYNQEQLDKLDERDGTQDGLVTLSGADCDPCLILTDVNNKKYITPKSENKGIIETTVHIYKTMNLDGTLSNEIQNFNFSYDEYNNLTRINILTNDSGIVYVTYSYQPKLYFDNVIQAISERQAKDTEDLAKINTELGPKDKNAPEYSTGIYGKYNKVLYDIQIKRTEKQQKITDFERLMGPALREGYWQPDNYSDYGDFYNESSTIISEAEAALADEQDVIISWDPTLFDSEDSLYYQMGIEQDYKFYPCVDLTSVFYNISTQRVEIPEDLDKYSVVWYSATTNDEYNWNSVKDLTIFGVGSKALIRFLKVWDDDNIIYKPVLMLTGAKTFSPTQLKKMICYDSSENRPRIEKYSVNVEEGTLVVSHEDIHYINNNQWLCYTTSYLETDASWPEELVDKYVFVNGIANERTVYPRIRIPFLSLKTDTTSLAIQYGNHLLAQFEDYYINTRDDYSNEDYHTNYYITIKPEALIKYGYSTSKKVTVYYTLSNANVAIYLDALKISKENAYPKVSYNLSANILDISLANKLYNKLARIVMINDTDLKFENVFGYISSLNLDLDKPWQDTIEVKNYTSKFEDLFSTIVAQTENIKQNEQKIASLLGGKLTLSEEGLEQTLNSSKKFIWDYLDSHFEGSEAVDKKLNAIFTEAGNILSQSNKRLNQLNNLTIENQEILSNFAQQAANKMAVQVFRSPNRPIDFKVGDIWIQTDSNNAIIGTYVATANSSDIDGNATNTSGFVRTYDGTLASIEGAAIKVDAEDGIIDLSAQNEINIKSGGNVYIAADDNVTILGDKMVSIGGTEINICTVQKQKLNPRTGLFEAVLDENNNPISVAPKGINLINGAYSFENGHYSGTAAHIIMKPEQMTIGAAEMQFESTGVLNFISSDTASVAALHISTEDGIWMGTNKGIRLYSSDSIIPLNPDGTLSSTASFSGASVELNSEHLILGYASITANGVSDAIFLDDTGILMATGSQIDSTTSVEENLDITGLSTGLIGAKFTQNSIGFATYSNNNVNAVLMDDAGITLGSGNVDITLPTTGNNGINLRATSASYVRIAASGIDIGSQSDIYINTKNLKLQTNATNTGNNLGTTLFAIGKDVSSITAGTSISSTLSNVNLLLNNNGLYIDGNSNIKMTVGSSLTFATSSNTSAFILDSSGASIKAGTIQLSSNNSNFIINNTGLFFNAKTNASDTSIELQITKDGTTIHSGTFGPWTLDQSGFKSADGTMGWTKTNTTNSMAFWIKHGSKTVFYYQNGKVYIRDLVLYNQPTYEYTSFGETSAGSIPSGGSSSGDGGSAPSTPTTSYNYNNIYTHSVYINGVYQGEEAHESKIYDGWTCKCGYKRS